MMDDMGLNDVLLRVVMEDIKEQRRKRVAANMDDKGTRRDQSGANKEMVSVTQTKVADVGKKKRIAKVGVRSSAHLKAHGIFKKGSHGAIAFGDPVVSDVESSSFSAASWDDDELKEAMMLEELYFSVGLEGPGVIN
ncbi:hypothetical protein AMTRI_Chr04g246580 [Amborella trichopoda]